MIIKNFYDRIKVYSDDILYKIFQILLLIFFAIIIYYVVRIIIKRLFSITFKHFKQPSFIKRRNTIEKITLSLWKYFAYFVSFLMILSLVGINVQTILTGAGILGVIFAFGSQELLSDFFEGFFNIFEDNLAVGDYVTIDTVEGTIYDIGLRTIKIKSYSGEVHIIPNSKIGHIINYSLSNGKALVDVRIDYDVDLYDALAVISKTLEVVKTSNSNVLSTPTILGVNKLDTIGYEIRIMCDTIKETHWGVQRYIRGELIKSFKEHNIKIGINQILIKDSHILK